MIVLSKNLEMRSANCGEIQELFFAFANSNKVLPENFTAELVDSFIAVLITLVSVNYGYPIALQTLTILLNYLKNDNKVFTRFHPNKELMIQLNFDRYLSTKGGEGKRFILNFICFLLRYYEDLE